MDTAKWIRRKNEYPECSSCGYHWIEEMVGIGKRAHSNIIDARYCPWCGAKITGEIKKDD